MLAALALVSIACTKELPEGASGLQESTELSAKLVGGTDGEIAPGTLLVRLDAQSVKAIEEGRLAEVSQDLLDGIEGATLRSALPVQPKNMEVARKYGLDQWFMVSFGSQTSAEELHRKWQHHAGCVPYSTTDWYSRSGKVRYTRLRPCL